MILCYDVTNANSFKNMRTWLDSIYEHAEEDVAKILVGNKVDLVEERKIS